MPAAPGKRAEWIIGTACVVAGLFFFSSLADLWPLAKVELAVPEGRLRNEARSFLEGRGYDLEDYRSAERLTVRTSALDYVEQSFGREQAQARIMQGAPLVYYRVTFKKRGEPIYYVANLHPEAGVVGWSKAVPEDYEGRPIAVDEARGLALGALAGGLRLAPADYEERSASTSEQSETRTHSFGFERLLSDDPELRERVSVIVSGDEVIAAYREIRVPAEAARLARSREAPGIAMETIGFALLAIAAVSAFFIFLRRLREGADILRRAALWPGVVFVCLLCTYSLQTAELFRNWEPLWPQWVSNLRYLVFSAIRESWLLVVLLAVIAAGDAVDRKLGAGRGESLWSLGRGRLLDPAVARASGRGFLVGLMCGGVMAAAVLLIQRFAGAETAIQPRGFFFYTLNSASPAVASLLFFLAVALAEELGYRFFSGGWLMLLTGRRWVAILLPALIYGLVHTRLDFLPPAEPFWGRAFVLTLVGCVWGWAFLRYDALTVVLSHFTADLFIFNWPRLASGRPEIVALAVVTICVPLLPLMLQPLRRLRGGTPVG